MPRQSRIDISGVIHHVIVRGIERRKIFVDDKDREEFLRRLTSSLEKTHCQCYAWCLIPNHFHILIRTGTSSLSTLMRSLLTGYALYFNKKHNRHGYLYQNRYKSILCQEEVYFLELIRYIHLNPLRSSQVRTMQELDKYRWCGHSALVGRIKREWQETGEVLIRFGKQRKKAIQEYRKHMRSGISMGKRDDLMGGGLVRSAGGWKELEKRKRRKDYQRGDERILGNGDFVERILEESNERFERQELLRRKGWDLERLAERVAEEFNIKVKEIVSKKRTRNLSRARSIIAFLGYNELGVQGAEIARYIAVSRSAITQAISRGKKEMEKINKNLIA